MARYPLTYAYDYARGDGWILTASEPLDDWEECPGGHRIEVALYFTDDERIETTTVTNAHGSPAGSSLRQNLDIGAKLCEYPGANAEAGVPFEDQPREVRMQRHAPDIYAAAEDARGMSHAIALRAASEFGATWAEKSAAEWESRVQMVGSGRASTIANEIKRR
jgi:hypothetical protein